MRNPAEYEQSRAVNRASRSIEMATPLFIHLTQLNGIEKKKNEKIPIVLMNKRNKADFTVGNISLLIFWKAQPYFRRRKTRRRGKAVPSKILVNINSRL